MCLFTHILNQSSKGFQDLEYLQYASLCSSVKMKVSTLVYECTDFNLSLSACLIYLYIYICLSLSPTSSVGCTSIASVWPLLSISPSIYLPKYLSICVSHPCLYLPFHLRSSYVCEERGGILRRNPKKGKGREIERDKGKWEKKLGNFDDKIGKYIKIKFFWHNEISVVYC